MLILILLLIMVCLSIVLAGYAIQIGGVQIVILAIVGLVFTSIIKSICKEAAVSIYKENKKQDVEDESMLSFDLLEIIGDWSYIPALVYAISSAYVIKRLIENFTLGNTSIIKPLVFLIIADLILLISCSIVLKKKVVPVVLYIEADVLNKTIVLLAILLLYAFVAGLYIFLSIGLVLIFLGD